MSIAWIPYGGYWSTPFVRWQGAFSELHSLKFAAWVAKRALGKRGIAPEAFDFGVLGFTVPQKGSFYGLPWLMGEIGAAGVGGPTIMQACATSARCVQTAAQEVAAGAASASLVLTCDRVSNGPHIYYPAPSAMGGAGESENWVLDNFARDPFANVAMIETAENVARKWGIERAEQDDMTLVRYTQYADALTDDRSFQRRYMDLPFDYPDATFSKIAGQLTGDEGIQPANADKVRALRPVVESGTVTYAGQTHPADGSAGMLVASRDAARDLSTDKSVDIAILGFGLARTEPAYMPAAPVPAAKRALEQAGLSISQVDAVKSHNPFIVNDIVFARETGFPLAEMNRFGCSLVWGHPQGPTGLRGLIELIEQLVLRGGGRGLFQGCAAGDTAMAVVIEVGKC
ncbi:MAG: thiolase family protein [Sphingomonadaceae bacterium]|nr:thiolase family protein [Sphingomonadaceae bacterium]